MEVKNLKPESLWRHFEAISSIPRGSGNESGVREYIISIAKKHNLNYKVDEKGNLVVSMKGTSGYERSPVVILQGHMDMVCEKNKGCNHDFTKDPIKLEIKGDYLHAKDTSMGGDNGIGLAPGLAIMENNDIPHPPLEFLFTVEEEIGLNGAKFLKGDFLEGRIMLNLDSEEEGDFYVGCAGGLDGEIRIDMKREDIHKGTKPYLIKLSGMKGGHSGLEIDKGHGNAIKVLARCLWNIMKEIDFQILSFSGGSKRNAIARESEASICIDENKVDLLKEKLSSWEKIIKKELGKIGQNLSIQLVHSENELPEKAFTLKSTELLLDLIYALPHGVVHMSRDIPNLVETSTNLGVIATDGDTIVITLNHRSSSATAILEVAEGIESLARLAGVKYLRGPGYPGWQPDMDSPVLKTAQETYKKLFNKEANIKAIHAGLECGIIGEKFPGMDMISFGPTMSGVHSPDEKLYIPSVELFWKFLVELLKSLK